MAMTGKAFGAAFCMLFAASLPLRGEEAEWNAYYSCLNNHVEDVARVVVSVTEGAELIAEVLCLNASTTVANKMAGRPIFEDRTFGDAFTASLSVIVRETREAVYIAKLKTTR